MSQVIDNAESAMRNGEIMKPSGQGSMATRALTIVAFALAMLVAFSFAFTPLRTSFDEFWHLKTGQWIVEHGWKLPQNDIFNYTAAALPWHNHEWLTQALMWKLYSWGEAADFGGWRAIILAKSLLIVASFAGFGLLLARRMRRQLWAALAALLAVALARRTITPRPLVISDLFVALLFWMLIEWRAGRLRERWLWLLAPLFALWANMHGGWQVGLTIIGAFWADAVVNCWLRSRRPTGSSHLDCGLKENLIDNPQSAIRNPQCRSVVFLTLLGVACVLGTLVNPFGYHLYELTSRVMKETYLVHRLNELNPPEWHHCWIVEGIILTMLAAALRPVRLRGGLATVLLVAAMIALFYFSTSPWFVAMATNEDNPSPLWLYRLYRFSANPWLWTAVALPALALAIVRLRPPGWFAHLLLVCFWTQQGLHHVRHLPLMALALMPTLAWSLEGWAEAWSRARAGAQPQDADAAPLDDAGKAAALVPERGQFATVLLGFAVLLALSCFWLFSRRELFSYVQRNRFLISGLETQPMPVFAAGKRFPIPSTLPGKGIYFIDAYPFKAVDFMLRAKLPAPLWNGGNYAGYLIWRLSPEYAKVFTDNRYDIFGGEVIREEHSVNEGWDKADLATLLRKYPHYFLGPTPPPWAAVLDKYGVQTVFIEADARGNQALYKSGHWVRVWEDFDFNIWVRDTPANKDAIARAQALPRPVTLQRVD